MEPPRPGLSMLELLTVAFVVLKLTGHIDWHWALVLSPVLIPSGLGPALGALLLFHSRSEG